MMGRSAVCLGLCAWLLAGSVASAVPIFVDFEKDATSVTAPGYTRMLQTNRFDTNTYITLGTGEQIGWKDYCSAGGVARTTASVYPNPGPLLTDFAGFGSGIVETFQVKNLVPGLYDLTLYAVDPAYKDKVTQFDIDQDNDGAFDAQVVIDWKNLSQVSKTVQVNVSPAGVLSMTVQRNGTAAGGALNGLDLVAVPEPATLLVLLVGAGVAAYRRR